MNAASIAQIKSTLSRSLSSPTDSDVLFAHREDVLQIVAPLLEIMKLFGCLTGLQMAFEISSTATNTGQSTSATAAKEKTTLGNKRRNVSQFGIRQDALVLWAPAGRARETYVEIGDKARHYVRYGSLADMLDCTKNLPLYP
jgi:hypothetical protein